MKYRIKKVTEGEVSWFCPQVRALWIWWDRFNTYFFSEEHARKAIENLKKPETIVEIIPLDNPH